MTAIDVVADPKPVLTFLREVEEVGKDELAREDRLREVQGLIRFARRFYRNFLREAFELEVKSFTFRDKRLLARVLVRLEDQEGPTAAREPEVALGEYFEDLVDVLHGDIHFGYSTDLEDFHEFHGELYPEWLDAVSHWLGFIGEEDLEVTISNLATRYKDVISI